MKGNYLLAACDSIWRKNYDISGFYGPNTLRAHLEKLLLCNLSLLGQITIICSGGRTDSEYYNIHDVIGRFQIPVVVVDVPNLYFSYSSWLQAFDMFRTFDFYVVIEDDYYPHNINFAEVLLEQHRRKCPGGGYLNSFTVDGYGAVSNGLIDGASFNNAVKNLSASLSFIAESPQVSFSKLFGPAVADYSDSHRCLFWQYGGMFEETHNVEKRVITDIFNPIQFSLITGPFKKVGY